MSIRISGGGIPVVNGPGRYAPAKAGRSRESFAAAFDQIQLSAQPAGQTGRVKQLAARLSQQIRTRPTGGELEHLRGDILSGRYRPYPGRIASHMLLRREEE